VTDSPATTQTARQAALFYDIGLTNAAIGNTAAAIDALRHATRLRPDLAGAWQALGDLLRRVGERTAAAAAYASERAALAGGAAPGGPEPAAVGDIEAGERNWAARLKPLSAQAGASLLRSHLATTAPTDVVAMRKLAELTAVAGQRLALLRRAVDLAPQYMAARCDLATMLFNQERRVDAIPHLEYILQREPQNTICRAFLAVCLGEIGQQARSIELYEECGEVFATETRFLLDYANALKFAGRRDDAVTLLRIVLESEPGNGMAWWTLADVKTEKFSAADIEAMRAAASDPKAPVREQALVNYALGRAFEQEGDYAQSFAHYARGAALRRSELNYDDSDFPNMARRMRTFFTPARFATTAGMGCPDPAPIFIVGLPRAGSTLVEQILASHSLVEGTQELPEISDIVRDIGVTDRGFVYPECLADYDAAALAALGQRYIDRTRIYRQAGRPYFIDKRPSNWAHVGLIHMILPNAKIIDVRRDPIANCFAAFKQYFGAGFSFSYNLDELVRYYRSYLDRMALFDEVLPGRVHRVLYEDLVNDSETQVRRLLEYCGLDFEPGCVRFWETQRVVATPSAEQVRRPIFREGLDQWRRYEPWLGPLTRAFGTTASPA